MRRVAIYWRIDANRMHALQFVMRIPRRVNLNGEQYVEVSDDQYRELLDLKDKGLIEFRHKTLVEYNGGLIPECDLPHLRYKPLWACIQENKQLTN